MRRSIVVGTKADLVDDAPSLARALGEDALAVSAVTGEGLEDLLERVGRHVEGGGSGRARADTVRGAPSGASALHGGARGRRLAREGPQRRAMGPGDRHGRRGRAGHAPAATDPRKGSSVASRRWARIPGDEVAIGDGVSSSSLTCRPRPKEPWMDAEAGRFAAEEDAAWTELHSTFAHGPATIGSRSRELTADGWSPKDAMFHVAAWCAEAANQLERMRLGTYVDPMIDSDIQNREWFDISKDLDVLTVDRRDPRRADQDARGVVRAHRAGLAHPRCDRVVRGIGPHPLPRAPGRPPGVAGGN